MQNPEPATPFVFISRIRMDGPESEERLTFELQVNDERMVLANIDKLLDALWFAQELKLISSLPATWWNNAKLHRDWGKPIRSAQSQEKLEKLDAKFAAKHERNSNKRFPAIEMDGETEAPYTLLLMVVLQCVYIAQQCGVIPPFGDEWLAREIWGLGSNGTKNQHKPYHLRSEPSSQASASIKQLRISASWLISVSRSCTVLSSASSLR